MIRLFYTHALLLRSVIGVHNLLMRCVYIQVQEIALDGGVNSAEPITTEPVVGADQLPETVVFDIPGVTENDAVLDHVVMGEKRSGNYDVSKTTILYHEAPSELPLFFLFLLVSLALFQVMP